jgi:hypothetical protein
METDGDIDDAIAHHVELPIHRAELGRGKDVDGELTLRLIV